MIFVSASGYHFKNFDWEFYLTTYRDVIEYKYNTKEKVWWHFLNIGEPKGYGYFDINDMGFGLTAIHDCIGASKDNRDIQVILKSYLKHNRVEKIIGF